MDVATFVRPLSRSTLDSACYEASSTVQTFLSAYMARGVADPYFHGGLSSHVHGCCFVGLHIRIHRAKAGPFDTDTQQSHPLPVKNRH